MSKQASNPIANVANLFAGMVKIQAVAKSRGRGASEGDIKPRLSFNPSNNGTQFNKKARSLFGEGVYSVAFNQEAGVIALMKTGESKQFRFLGIDQVFELAGGTSTQTMKVELTEIEKDTELAEQGFIAYGAIELKEKEVVPGRGKRKAQKVDDTEA